MFYVCFGYNVHFNRCSLLKYIWKSDFVIVIVTIVIIVVVVVDAVVELDIVTMAHKILFVFLVMIFFVTL